MGQFDDIQFINQAQLKQVMLANADKADKRYVKKTEYDPSTFATVDSLGALASKDDVGLEDLDAALAATIEAKADAADVATMDDVNAAIATAIDGLGDLASLDEVAESDLSAAVQNKINNVYTKAEVYTRAETESAIDDAVSAKISGLYHPVGSIAFEDLPELSATVLGNVYTVTDDFVTDERFVEEVGTKVTAGTNVAVVEPEEGVFKFDAFATAIDLIDYVKKGENRVRVFTDDGKFISSDCRHLTKAGAIFYAHKIPLAQYLE